MAQAKSKANAVMKKKPKATAKKKAKAKAAPQARAAKAGKPASGWQQATLARMRELIFEADPKMIEERKWVKPTKPLGVPVFSHDGIVCTGETYQQVVKLTFMYGASLPDPTKLFNSSLAGGRRRAIDIPEAAKINASALKALIKAAVAFNTAKKRR